jgi:hypothetical protein
MGLILRMLRSDYAQGAVKAPLAPCVVLGWALLWAGIASGSQPNIVMIVSDDVGYNELGFSSALNNGATEFQTPNLDALAQQSVVGSRFYSTDSICAPSRAGLLTGQYQQRYGFEQNTTDGTDPVATFGPVGLSGSQNTIAQQLKGLGYSTGAIGKWHLGYTNGLNLPQDKGFDEFYGFWGGARQYFADAFESHVMRRGTTDIESTWQSEGDRSSYDPLKGRYTTDALIVIRKMASHFSYISRLTPNTRLMPRNNRTSITLPTSPIRRSECKRRSSTPWIARSAT